MCPQPHHDRERVCPQTHHVFRAYLRDHPSHPDVVVHHGGPTLAADGETPNGLLLVMETPSLDAARAFLNDCPYAKVDIFAECDLRAWDWYTGRPSS